MKCEDCKFWDQDFGRMITEHEGICRRYPPKNSTIETREGECVNDNEYPVTAEWEWCGEFKRTGVAMDFDKFSCRTKRALARADIKTVDQVNELTDNELLQLRNFGHTSLKEVRRGVGLFEKNQQ